MEKEKEEKEGKAGEREEKEQVKVKVKEVLKWKKTKAQRLQTSNEQYTTTHRIS